MPPSMAGTGDFGWRGQNRVRAGLALARRGTALGWDTWRYLRRMRQTLSALRPDLIHSNGIKFHLLSRLTGGSPVPVVWHVHDFFGARPLVARGLRWAARRAAGAIAISQAVAEDARRVLRSVPVAVVYNAIDTVRFTPGPGDARLDSLAGLPPAPPRTVRVGLVATYARWKGHDIFLRAIARLVRQQPDTPARFYLIGGPIYQTAGSQFTENELRARAAELAVTPHVGFIPFQQDPAGIYRALDLVVHASTQPEPFGLTVVEAMACAKPVIVTRAGGVTELFTPGHDAVGVPPGDDGALATALRELIHQPSHRTRLGENARRTAVERFRRERLGPQILTAYRQFASFPAQTPHSPAQSVSAWNSAIK
jgi:glycosyltransferase involved in cell wall biosynthesis